MSRLTKSEREQIIIKYLKNQETPGYQVIECKNGKYQVRVKPEPELKFEVEEDTPEEAEEEPEVKPVHSKTSSKQNARKLLAQLSELMTEASEEDDNEDEGIYYNGPSNPPRHQTWERKRLRLI